MIRIFVLKMSVVVVMFTIVWGEASLAESQESQENVIHVDVIGLHSDRGQVRCALYSSAAGFPKKANQALAHATSEISGGRATCEFQSVRVGVYAVAVFHDENANGKLDTNFVGIPREGVGASNNAKGHFGPPKFSAAAFQHSGGRTNLKISIHYL